MIRVFFILLLVPCVAFAMADGTPPVYGRPTLYGEYEARPADVRRAAALYGVAPQNVAVKMPVRPKKIASKKVLDQKKTTKKVASKKAQSVPRVAKKDVIAAVDVIVVPPKQAVTVTPPKKAPPVPATTAVAIADVTMAEMAPTIESFCVQRGRRPARVPDGYVLMPGRPDLMSCVDK